MSNKLNNNTGTTMNDRNRLYLIESIMVIAKDYYGFGMSYPSCDDYISSGSQKLGLEIIEKHGTLLAIMIINRANI